MSSNSLVLILKLNLQDDKHRAVLVMVISDLAQSFVCCAQIRKGLYPVSKVLT